MKVLLVLLAFLTIVLLTIMRVVLSKLRYLKNKVFEQGQYLQLLELMFIKRYGKENETKEKRETEKGSNS